MRHQSTYQLANYIKTPEQHGQLDSVHHQNTKTSNNPTNKESKETHRDVFKHETHFKERTQQTYICIERKAYPQNTRTGHFSRMLQPVERPESVPS